MDRGRSKPVVFVDFDGTICHDRYWRSLPTEKQAELQAFLFRDNPHIVIEWMRGLHTAEAINHLVAHTLRMPYDEVWALFVADCRSMRVAEGTLTLLKDLRRSANLILTTGNMDSFSRFTVPALELDSYFDAKQLE